MSVRVSPVSHETMHDVIRWSEDNGHELIDASGDPQAFYALLDQLDYLGAPQEAKELFSWAVRAYIAVGALAAQKAQDEATDQDSVVEVEITDDLTSVLASLGLTDLS